MSFWAPILRILAHTIEQIADYLDNLPTPPRDGTPTSSTWTENVSTYPRCEHCRNPATDSRTNHCLYHLDQTERIERGLPAQYNPRR
jgi:hypothetical protein